MIKNKLKNQKGISLITLSITVIVLMIVTNAIIYNAKNNLIIEKLENMHEDVGNLRAKVNEYYTKYGTLPVLEDGNKNKIIYNNIAELKDEKDASGNVIKSGIISDVADVGNFYIIDLVLLDNLTLNYGEDYKGIKDGSITDLNTATNIYIINESSQNIFFVRGINVDGKKYYTDYTEEDKDTKSVDLRIVNGIPIPEGYVYDPLAEYEVVICKKEDKGNVGREQYFWRGNKFNNIGEISNDWNVGDDQAKYEFLESANSYGGAFFPNYDITQTPVHIKPKWTPKFDETSEYKDKNGDIVVVPANFQVSMDPDKNTVNNGLVVRGPDGSEFVWVPVDKETFSSKFKRTYGCGYSKENQLFYEGYFEPTDEVDANGINKMLLKYGRDESQETKEEAKKMYASVKKNGGFYIGRFEASGINNVVDSKRGKMPYYGLKWGNGTNIVDDTDGMVRFARNMNKKEGYGSVTSTLCYDIQWDATLNFIDSDYITNEVDGKPICKANSPLMADQGINRTVTGSSELYKMKNIYDLSGNFYETTMAYMHLDGQYIYDTRVVRGNGNATLRYISGTNVENASAYESFRVALYVNNV